jgi:hypothetical protein
MFPSACSFIVLVLTVSLHVSGYVAIFKCVGCFIFICLKDSALLLFFHVVRLCTFSSVGWVKYEPIEQYSEAGC